MDSTEVEDDDETSKLHGKAEGDDSAHTVSAPASRFSRLLGAIVALSIAFIYLAYSSFTYNDPANASQCEMAWMSPGYLRLDGLDSSYSRLAQKYSLWLYREQGWDLSNKPHGVPVLFAPGNAGSYRQVRSLAAEAARSFYQSPGQPRQDLLNEGSRELDVFAADFNEDFSAFHAATLREQAEYLVDAVQYILELYDDTPESSRPSSVIMLAHSMGGIATRLMLLQPKYRQDSISTIVTFSTPHAIPPATFDAGIEKVYTEINDFWRESYKSGNDLDDLLLVSIAGGTADTTVSSDYSGISGFTPARNGFTVLTTSVPSLFSPVDHLAMMWCDQLRKSVVQALLRSVDARAPNRVKSSPQRLDIMKQYLLTGLEGPLAMPSLGNSQSFALGEVSFTTNSPLRLAGGVPAGLYGFSVSAKQDDARLIIWTDAKTDALRVFACNGNTDQLQCQRVEKPAFVRLPLSSTTTDTGTVTPVTTAHTSYLELKIPHTCDTIVLHVLEASPGFLHAQTASSRVQQVETSLIRLAMLGWHVELSNKHLMTRFHFPSLDTSLLAYKVTTVRVADCATPPLLRVKSSDVHESIFYPNPSVITIFLHSSPPFLPADSSSRGLNLQIWQDPECELQLTLRIDWFTSIGQLVLRYRSLVTAWPVLIILLCLRRQLATSIEKEVMSFSSALGVLVRAELPWLCVISACLSVLQASAIQLGFGSHAGFYNLLLGNSQIIFVGLAALFLSVVTGKVCVVHLVLSLLLNVSASVWAAWSQHAPRRFSRNPKFTNVREQWVKTRIGTFAALALLILVFAPHQFAFLVLLLVQLDNTLRALTISRSSKDEIAKARFEHNYTLLLLMVFLLPQNAAILLVWLCNLQAGWYAPFPSDHSIFSVQGYLLLVEYMQTGKVLKSSGRAWLRYVTDGVFYLSAVIVLAYGARFAYLGGLVSNAVYLVLFVVQYF